MSLTPIGDLGIALKADIDDYQKSMATASDSTSLLTGSLRGLTAAVRNTGLAITAVSAGSAAALTALSLRAEKVNEQFRELETISGEVENAQERYGAIVDRLNTEMGINADRSQVLSAVYQSLSAGVDAAQESQREFLTTAANLAVVGRTELETTVDVLSTSMNAYGRGTEFAKLASEVLFRTVQNGKVRMEELAPVMGRVTAIGSDLGVSIQAAGAAMALLTKTGFEARIAATGLRAIMRAFQKPSEDMEQALMDIALSNDLFASKMGDAEDQVRSIADDIRNLNGQIKEQRNLLDEAANRAEESSLKIREARLLEIAIEQDRRDEVEDVISTNVARLDSEEEVAEFINKKRLEQKKARLEEEKAQDSVNELESKLQSAKDTFTELKQSSGNLDEGIGNLILQNQGFVSTLQDVNQISEEQNIQLSDLFDETRALQAATALVSGDTEDLKSILAEMPGVTQDAKGAIQDFNEDGKIDEDILENLNFEEEAQDFRGPITRFRDSISELKSSLTDLGNVFAEDTLATFNNFVDFVTNSIDKFKSLDESTKTSISRFAILATSIGLIVGPLLLIAGQFALVAGSLATLVPFLGIVAPLVGIVATAFSQLANQEDTVPEDLPLGLQKIRGESSQVIPIVDKLIGIFKNVKSFALELASIFNDTLKGPLIELGNAFTSLFSSIYESLGGTSQAKSSLRGFASVVGGLLSKFASFISENEAAITKFVVSIIGLAKVFLQQIIPTISSVISYFGMFKEGLKDAFGKIPGGGIFSGRISSNIQRIIKATKILINTFIELAKTNEFQFFIGMTISLIASLVFIVTELLAAIADIVIFLEPVLVPSLRVLTFTLGMLAGMFAIIGGLIGGFIAALRKFIEPWMIIIPLIVAFSSTLGLIPATMLFIVTVTVATAQIIVNIFKWLYNKLVGNSIIPELVQAIKNILFGGFNDIIDKIFTKGKNIVTAIANGIKSGIGKVKDAIGKVTGVVSDHLPSSPAKMGPLADEPPKESGKQTAEDFSEGLNSLDSEEFNMTEPLSADTSKLETEVSPQANSDGGGTGTGFGSQKDGQEDTEINVSERAIYFESGAFRGVSDDEIPTMVRREIKESLGEILEEAQSRGAIR